MQSLNFDNSLFFRPLCFSNNGGEDGNLVDWLHRAVRSDEVRVRVRWLLQDEASSAFHEPL